MSTAYNDVEIIVEAYDEVIKDEIIEKLRCYLKEAITCDTTPDENMASNYYHWSGNYSDYDNYFNLSSFLDEIGNAYQEITFVCRFYEANDSTDFQLTNAYFKYPNETEIENEDYDDCDVDLETIILDHPNYVKAANKAKNIPVVIAKKDRYYYGKCMDIIKALDVDAYYQRRYSIVDLIEKYTYAINHCKKAKEISYQRAMEYLDQGVVSNIFNIHDYPRYQAILDRYKLSSQASFSELLQQQLECNKKQAIDLWCDVVNAFHDKLELESVQEEVNHKPMRMLAKQHDVFKDIFKNYPKFYTILRNDNVNRTHINDHFISDLLHDDFMLGKYDLLDTAKQVYYRTIESWSIFRDFLCLLENEELSEEAFEKVDAFVNSVDDCNWDLYNCPTVKDFYKKHGVVLIFIAGTKFRNVKKIKKEITHGMAVTMEKEPTNKFDKNAIKVVTMKGLHLGYVPKYAQKEIDDPTCFEGRLVIMPEVCYDPDTPSLMAKFKRVK